MGEYITLDEFDEITEAGNGDQFYTQTADGKDGRVKASTLKQLMTPPDADSLTKGLVTTGNQAFSGKKTFKDGIAGKDLVLTENAQISGDLNVDGDFTINGEPFNPGGGSALVPSMTQEEYNALTHEEKTNGQIREITDAEGSPIPFAILNDEMETASNVWSAQKVKEKCAYYPDYANPVTLPSLTAGSITLEEDCYIVFFSIQGTITDLELKINGTTVNSAALTGTVNRFFLSFSGYAKKGDILSWNKTLVARELMIYKLR